MGSPVFEDARFAFQARLNYRLNDRTIENRLVKGIAIFTKKRLLKQLVKTLITKCPYSESNMYFHLYLYLNDGEFQQEEELHERIYRDVDRSTINFAKAMAISLDIYPPYFTAKIAKVNIKDYGEEVNRHVPRDEQIVEDIFRLLTDSTEITCPYIYNENGQVTIATLSTPYSPREIEFISKNLHLVDTRRQAEIIVVRSRGKISYTNIARAVYTALFPRYDVFDEENLLEIGKIALLCEPCTDIDKYTQPLAYFLGDKVKIAIRNKFSITFDLTTISRAWDGVLFTWADDGLVVEVPFSKLENIYDSDPKLKKIEETESYVVFKY